MTHKHHVICFQQRLTHYREEFFQRCKDELSCRNIRFDLVYGMPDAAALAKDDGGNLFWGSAVNVKSYSLAKKTGVWVPMPPTLSRPDLVVITQENKLLANYAWLLRRYLCSVKVAFWGHGRNFQSNSPSGLRERWKKFLIGRVDWWFAYTELSRDALLQASYPPSRISVLNNAIDNAAFCSDLMAVSSDALALCKSRVGDGPVALFCGSLYADKKISLMIEAADRIRAVLPNFALVVIGDGPSAGEVVAAAKQRPWLHVLGAKKGLDKAVWFKMAKVVFNPGAVGLHILDSFAAGVPMVTTRSAKHGPEIAYLVDMENGLVVDGGAVEYADAIIELLQNRSLYEKIQKNGLASSEVYTLDNMVAKFVEGVEACLAMSKK